MESQVSPKNIEARVEALAAESNEKPVVETPAVEAPKVEAPKVEVPKVEVPKVEAPRVEAPKVEVPKVEAPKVEPPKVEKKQPNDPAELRKWATKASQDAAAAREEVKALKVAIEKMAKKPVDYAALAKDPEALRKHVEAEREEASAELKEKLKVADKRAAINETLVEKVKRENDKENYPRWEKLFPLIQTLATNGDGRIDWNNGVSNALDEAYALADKLSPAETPAAAAVAEPVAPVVEKGMSKAEVDALVAKAKDEARKEAEANLRAEAAGGGVGSKGKGGSRDPNVSSDALRKMPLKDLKTMIQKQS